ncbi:hypothetical protein ACWCQK_16195 [Streptomyces sp. NPDC002306]
MTFNGSLYAAEHEDGGGNAQWINEVNAALGNPDIHILVDLGALDEGELNPQVVFRNAVAKGRAAKGDVKSVRGTAPWRLSVTAVRR